MTTIGEVAYSSIVNDHPWMGQIVPDQYIRTIDSLRQMLDYAAYAEREAFATANKVIAAHNRGALLPADYTNYDHYRHTVHDAQVAWLRATRSALAVVPGGNLYAARIPWPGWLTPLRATTPRNVPQMRLVVPTGGAAGLGVTGAEETVGFAGVAITIAIIIAGAVLIGMVIHYFSTTIGNWMVLHQQTAVLRDAITARTTAFDACVNAGTSAESCAAQVRAAIPAPSQAAIDHIFEQTAGKGALWYLGLATALAITAGGTYYGYQKGWFK